LNPIENEAVVASAIDRCGGTDKVKLISKDDALPGLKRNPGLKTWEVLDRTGEWWSSYKSMVRTREEKGLDMASKVVEGMFPPDESQDVPLERCMRVYPHMQDTGGFFIAVLEKQTEIKARPENQAKAAVVEDKNEPLQGSAMAIVDEINALPRNGEADLDKLKTADDLDAAQAPEATNENGAVEAAAAEANGTGSPSNKRSIDEADPAGEEATVKRLKVRNEELHDDTLSESVDRTVHFPPPPAATDSAVPEQGLATTTTDAPPDPQSKRHTNAPMEESFIYLPSDHPELAEATAFYHLSSRFPIDRFMVRNPAGDPVKAIYYTSGLAKSILQSNEKTGIKFVHCGVKMFVKQDVSTLQNAGLAQQVSKWRIQSEGLPILEGWVGEERVVRVWRRPTLRRLLVEMFPRIEEGNDDLGELKEQVQHLGPGCAVLRVEPRKGEADDGEGFTERLTMPLWRGATSVNLMLPKDERKAMLLRLYNDDSELVDNSKGGQERRDREKEEKAARRGGKNERGQPRKRVDPNYADTASEKAGPGPGGDDRARIKAEDEDEGGVALTLAEIEAAESADENEGMDVDIKTEIEPRIMDQPLAPENAVEAEKGTDITDKADNLVDAAKQIHAEETSGDAKDGEDTRFNRTV